MASTVASKLTLTASVLAPTSIAEDSGASLSLSVVLLNVSQASGTITMSFASGQSTATNGSDVSVPTSSLSYQVSQFPTGPYIMDLPSISVLTDQMPEGTETIAVTIRASGRIFDTGTDTKIVTIKLIDSGQTGGMLADRLTGTSFTDDISGGGGNDILSGGAGNDNINGGGGIDVAQYSITRSAATITRNDDGSLKVAAGADGTDTLLGVEKLQFSDGRISFFTFDDPGAVLVSNFAVGAGGWNSQDLYPRHIADVNGDGFSDIVGFGNAGVLVSFGSANGSFTNAGLAVSNFGQTAGWSSDNRFHRELADVNGDGLSDILGFGIAGTLVSLANADGSFDNLGIGVTDFGSDQGWASQDGFARTVGDVNGDGNADLVGFGYAGTLVSLGNGDGTFQGASLAVANFGVEQGWTSDNLFHRTVADVNGDGADDIVGFGYAGTLVALSNGDGTFGQAQFALANFGKDQGWASQDGFTRDVADINEDGFADVVGFGIEGTFIAYGEANGGFSTASFGVDNFGQNQGWTSDTAYHRELADINNDGLNDIVGFGYAGVLAGLNQGDWLI